MIIYNVTINVENDIHEEWLNWMKNVHIPDVMNTGFFTAHKMCKVLTQQEGETGNTYAIQYSCNSMKELDEYLEKKAPELQMEHTNRYRDKFVAFRTLLEVV